MNAHDLLSDAPLGPGDSRAHLLYARLLLAYLADHLRDATLADGRYLCEVGDFVALCRELVEEARKIGQFPDNRVTRMPQPRYAMQLCPDCTHEHKGRGECREYLGEGKFCHCPSKVPA